MVVVMRPRRPPPSLSELVGDDVPPEELERLWNADELLRSVPPAPEVPSSLTASVLALGRRPQARQRRRLLAVALLAAALGAAAGSLFVSSTRGDDFETVDRVALRPTSEAPRARMAIDVGVLDEAGNWPLLGRSAGSPGSRRAATTSFGSRRPGAWPRAAASLPSRTRARPGFT